MIYDTENQHIILVDSLPSGTYEPASWDDYEEGTFAWAITQANAYDGELEVVVQIDSSLSGQSLNDWSSMEFCSVTRSMSIVCEGYNMPYWYGSLYVEGYGVNLKVNGFYLNSVGTSSWASAGDTIELEHVYLSEGIYLQGDDMHLIMNNSQAPMLDLYGHNLTIEGSGNALWGNWNCILRVSDDETTYDISDFYFEADETYSYADLYVKFTEDTTLYSTSLEEMKPENLPCKAIFNASVDEDITITIAENQEINFSFISLDKKATLRCEPGSTFKGHLQLSGGTIIANDTIFDGYTNLGSGRFEASGVTFKDHLFINGAQIVGDNIRVECPIVESSIFWDGDETNLLGLYDITNTTALPNCLQKVSFFISKNDATITQSLLEGIHPAFCERTYLAYLNVSNNNTVFLDKILWDNEEDKHIYLDSGSIMVSNSSLSGKLRIHDWRPADLTSTILQNCTFNQAELNIELYGDLSMTGCSGNGQLNLQLRNGGDGTFVLCENDFSQMQLKLDIPDGSVIDLSGNYWGSMNRDDIIAKIENYSEEKVILKSVLPSPPSREFCLATNELICNRLASGANSITVQFNNDVDASTVTNDSVRLINNQKSAVAITHFEIKGSTLTLHFEPLTEGSYRLQLMDSVRDIHGNAFNATAQTAPCYLVSHSVDPKVLLFRCNSTVTDQFSYVDIFFDQEMNSATLTKDSIHLFNEAGQEWHINRVYQSTVNGNTFYRVLLDTVTATGNYRLQIDDTVESVVGVALRGGYTQELYISSPDLVTEAKVLCSDNRLGRYTTISYTITNKGDGAVKTGTWKDTIYLCRTKDWDESQAFAIGSVTHYRRSLNSNESYTENVRCLLDDMEDGTYYIFIKTDVSAHVSESNEHNNVSATGTRLDIVSTEHEIGERTESLDSANERLYYSFTARNNNGVLFSLSDPAASVYVCEAGTVPLAETNIATNYLAENQLITNIPTEKGKTYTIAVRPRSTEPITSKLEESSGFKLLNVSASALSVGRPVTMSVYGAGFTENALFALRTSDGTLISPRSVSVLSPFAATLSFTVPENLTVGSSLVLTAKANSEAEETRLHTPISVAAYKDTVRLEFPAAEEGKILQLRTDFIWKTELKISNKSAADIRNALILVSDTHNGYNLYYDYEDKCSRSALLLMGGSNDASQSLLTHGETETLEILVSHHTEGKSHLEAYILSPEDDSTITTEQWDAFSSALRPDGVSDDVWMSWWGKMRPRIGNTVADFTKFIYGMQETAFASGRNTGAPLSNMVSDMMHHEPNYNPNYYIEGTVTEIGGCTPKANVMISLYRRDGDIPRFVECTYSDQNGHYRFLVSNHETYEISLPKEHADFDRDNIIDDNGAVVTIENQDVEINPILIATADDAEVIEFESFSQFAAASENRMGRLWIKGKELRFCEFINNTWSQSICLTENQVDNYDLVWDEMLHSYVVSWTEQGESNDAYMMIITPCEDYFVFYQPAQIYQGEDTLQLIQGENGNYLFVTNAPDGRIGYIGVDATEDVFYRSEKSLTNYQELNDAGILDISLDGLGQKISFDYEIPFLGLTLSGQAETNRNLIDSCTLKDSISASIGVSKDKLAGPYIPKTVTGSLTHEESRTYSYNEQGQKDTKDYSSSSLSINYYDPQALISILKKIPFASGLGGSLSALRSWLTKHGGNLLAGLDFTFNEIYEQYDEEPNKITISGSLTVFGGAEAYNHSKKKNPVQAHLSGTLGVNLQFNARNLFDIDFGSFTGSVLGTTKVSVRIPFPVPFLGLGAFEGTWEWGFGKPEDEIAFSIQDAPKLCLARSATFGSTTYTFITDENSEGFSSLQVQVRDNNGTVRSIVVDSVYNKDAGPLAKGKGYITDISCETVSDGILVIMEGYTNLPQISSDKVYYLEDIDEIYERAQQGKCREILKLTKDQIIAQSFEDTHDVISSQTKVFSSGKIYQTEVTRLLNGKSCVQIRDVSSRWDSSPRVIYTTDRPITDILLNEVAERPIIQFIILDDSEEGLERDEIVYMSEKNGKWEEFYVTSALPYEAPSETTGFLLNRNRYFSDPWEALKDCIYKPTPTPIPGPETETITSKDPNDILGSQGYGAQNWVARQEMQFMVECENEAEENIAHAAMITITQHIDEAFDYASFRLGDMMIAGQYIEVKGEVQSYKARLDWRGTLGVWVDVNAFFDADTGDVRWEFLALDPESMMVVADPFKGLLAPNFNSPEGEGAVFYYVTPKATAASGTEMKAEASIVFDFNEAIATPTLNYTLDVDAPVATVQEMAATSTSRYLLVSWEGQDVGSGIAGYNIFVSADGGDWALWQENITATSALFRVAEGEHSYFFMAQGMDHAGNTEQLGDTVQAEAGTISTYTAEELRVSAISAAQTDGNISFAVTFATDLCCDDWAQALSVNAGETMLDLSLGTLSYDADTRTLSWQGDAQGIADGQKLQFLLNPSMVSDTKGNAYAGTLSFSAAVESSAAGSTYAAPTLYDYNGDGLLDLIVGEKATDGGRVRLYLNEGTAEAPVYTTFVYATTAADTPLTEEAEGCQGAIVRFADLTGDGKDEMLIGLADGNVRVFTAAEGGHWTDAGLLTCTIGGKASTVKVINRAALEVTDFNGDGKTDLLIGTGDGDIVLYLNEAENGISLGGGQYLHDSKGRIRISSRASVAAGDFDGDGLSDLVVADSTGAILFYRNEGSSAAPLFGEAVRVLISGRAADLSADTTRIRLDAADLNNDGKLDLVAGLTDGRILTFYGAEDALLLGTAHAGAIPLPDAPQEVKLTPTGSTLYLTWEATEGKAISYEVSLLTEGAAEAEIIPCNGNTLALPLPDGNYTVQVRALNQGHAGAWCTQQSITIDTVAPDAPTDSSFAHTENGISLSWAAVNDADGYELRYRIAGTETWRTVSVNEAQADITLSANGLYEWQVRATDAAGNSSAWLAGNAFSIGHIASDTEQHWAAGLHFDTAGTLIGGYYDINKSGSGDSELCWAAADANVLAWWQSNSVSGSVPNGVPNTAESIYATFTENWDNTAGADVYGLIWWLSGTAASDTYTSYYNRNYTGDTQFGGYYSRYYKPDTVAESTAQVSLKGSDATAETAAWADIYDKGGMITLGVFRSVSGGTLSGGHSLTLWGYTADAETGQLTELFVTDSDDGKSGITTLSVAYNESTGFYHITGGSNTLAGYLLGTYTYLTAFANLPVVTLGTESVVKNGDGTAQVTFRWSAESPAVYVLSVNGRDYNLRGATSYTLTLPESVREYTLTATNAEGNSITLNGTLLYDTKPAHATAIALTNAESGLVTPAGHVTDTIGGGDEQDYYRFTATEDGTYAIGTDITTPGGSFLLSLGTVDAAGDYVVQRSLITGAGSTNAIEGINLRKGETAYIRISSEETEETAYELRVVGEVPAKASLTDNNTAETADTLVGSTAPAAVQGWVGYGDACDFYRLQLAEESNLQLTLSGVDTAARVKVYAEQTDGSRALISAGTATAATGLDRTLALTAGSYFIEVSSLNPDNGLSNSAYTMELKEQKGKQNTHYMLAMR